jgi:hypothetical protein
MGFCSFTYEELRKVKGYENMGTETLAKIKTKKSSTL